VGSYEFVYENNGYNNVEEDYWAVGNYDTGNVDGNQLFVRIKGTSDCSAGAWELVLPNLECVTGPTHGPTLVPSSWPTVVPTLAPTAPPTVRCAGFVADTPEFVDALGYACTSWVGYDCANVEQGVLWGYTKTEFAAVGESCPLSCDMCETADMDVFPNERGSNGAGSAFECLYGQDGNSGIARAACESVYGAGQCAEGDCGAFYYWYFAGHPSCDCYKPVGAYEFVYLNTGYTKVGEDYGQVGGAYVGGGGGSGLFVRVKSSGDCDDNSWTLALDRLECHGYARPTAAPTTTADDDVPLHEVVGALTLSNLSLEAFNADAGLQAALRSDLADVFSTGAAPLDVTLSGARVEEGVEGERRRKTRLLLQVPLLVVDYTIVFNSLAAAESAKERLQTTILPFVRVEAYAQANGYASLAVDVLGSVDVAVPQPSWMGTLGCETFGDFYALGETCLAGDAAEEEGHERKLSEQAPLVRIVCTDDAPEVVEGTTPLPDDGGGEGGGEEGSWMDSVVILSEVESPYTSATYDSGDHMPYACDGYAMGNERIFMQVLHPGERLELWERWSTINFYYELRWANQPQGSLFDPMDAYCVSLVPDRFNPYCRPEKNSSPLAFTNGENNPVVVYVIVSSIHENEVGEFEIGWDIRNVNNGDVVILSRYVNNVIIDVTSPADRLAPYLPLTHVDTYQTAAESIGQCVREGSDIHAFAFEQLQPGETFEITIWPNFDDWVDTSMPNRFELRVADHIDTFPGSFHVVCGEYGFHSNTPAVYTNHFIYPVDVYYIVSAPREDTFQEEYYRFGLEWSSRYCDGHEDNALAESVGKVWRSYEGIQSYEESQTFGHPDAWSCVPNQNYLEVPQVLASLDDKTMQTIHYYKTPCQAMRTTLGFQPCPKACGCSDPGDPFRTIDLAKMEVVNPSLGRGKGGGATVAEAATNTPWHHIYFDPVSWADPGPKGKKELPQCPGVTTNREQGFSYTLEYGKRLQIDLPNIDEFAPDFMIHLRWGGAYPGENEYVRNCISGAMASSVVDGNTPVFPFTWYNSGVNPFGGYPPGTLWGGSGVTSADTGRYLPLNFGDSFEYGESVEVYLILAYAIGSSPFDGKFYSIEWSNEYVLHDDGGRFEYVLHDDGDLRTSQVVQIVVIVVGIVGLCCCCCCCICKSSNKKKPRKVQNNVTVVPEVPADDARPMPAMPVPETYTAPAATAMGQARMVPVYQGSTVSYNGIAVPVFHGGSVMPITYPTTGAAAPILPSGIVVSPVASVSSAAPPAVSTVASATMEWIHTLPDSNPDNASAGDVGRLLAATGLYDRVGFERITGSGLKGLSQDDFAGLGIVTEGDCRIFRSVLEVVKGNFTNNETGMHMQRVTAETTPIPAATFAGPKKVVSEGQGLGEFVEPVSLIGDTSAPAQSSNAEIGSSSSADNSRSATGSSSFAPPPLVKRESEIRRQVNTDHEVLEDIVQRDQDRAEQALQEKLAKRKRRSSTASFGSANDSAAVSGMAVLEPVSEPVFERGEGEFASAIGAFLESLADGYDQVKQIDKFVNEAETAVCVPHFTPADFATAIERVKFRTDKPRAATKIIEAMPADAFLCSFVAAGCTSFEDSFSRMQFVKGATPKCSDFPGSFQVVADVLSPEEEQQFLATVSSL
jgi:hypothetical protein